MKGVLEAGYPEHEMRENESSIEFLLCKVITALCSLNQICFICLNPLGKAFKKMRTCMAERCEFSFEENNLGNIFNEVKLDPDNAHFLIESAYMAFTSRNAGSYTEPFPTFLLINQEIRAKTG